jgi:hypothetical protein
MISSKNGKEGHFPEPADLPDEAAKGTKLEKYRIQLKMALTNKKITTQQKAVNCPTVASVQMLQETGDEKALERLAWYS